MSFEEFGVSEDNIYLTYSKRISSRVYYEEMIEEVIIPLLPSEERGDVEKIMDSDKRIYEKYNEVNQIVFQYSASLKGQEKEDFDNSLKKDLEEFMMEFSKRTEINSAIVIIGMIGGLFVFGILGLILGPLILGYVLLILEIYRKKTSESLFFKKIQEEPKIKLPELKPLR